MSETEHAAGRELTYDGGTKRSRKCFRRCKVGASAAFLDAGRSRGDERRVMAQAIVIVRSTVSHGTGCETCECTI